MNCHNTTNLRYFANRIRKIPISVQLELFKQITLRPLQECFRIEHTPSYCTPNHFRMMKPKFHLRFKTGMDSRKIQNTFENNTKNKSPQQNNNLQPHSKVVNRAMLFGSRLHHRARAGPNFEVSLGLFRAGYGASN